MLVPSSPIESVERKLSALPVALLVVFFLCAAPSFAATSRDSSLRVGLNNLAVGKTEAALPFLIPKLDLLNPQQLEFLEERLQLTKHTSVALMVLRHHASREKGFSRPAGLAGTLAFRNGQFQVCRDILAPFVANLDTGSAYRFLLSNFFIGGKLDPDIVRKAASRSDNPDVKDLVALNYALQGNFKEARLNLDRHTPASIQNFIQAKELDAADKIEEATDYFRKALDTPWPEFRVVVQAELFKHYSLTGNRLKADQLWEMFNGDADLGSNAALRELLAYQLGIRNYEKQMLALYSNLYHSHPDRPVVLKALWNDLLANDSTGLNAHIHTLLAADSLDCDANVLAMRYASARHNNPEVMGHGGHVLLYCTDPVEPYLSKAMLELNLHVEPRAYFGIYVERGGDKNSVPTPSQ